MLILFKFKCMHKQEQNICVVKIKCTLRTLNEIQFCFPKNLKKA